MPLPSITVKESIADLKEVGPSTGISGFKLVHVIGKGLYQYKTGDQSSQDFTTDTWVAPSEDTSGKSGAWNRIERTGHDDNVVSGTAGGNWDIGIWNADGDLVGGIPALPGFIDGLELSNNSTDSAHDIDIATGVCSMRDGSGNRKLFELTSSLTKQIDADWAEGTDAGGFPSGLTLASDTHYNVFLIGKDDGSVDSGFDTDASASNLLSDASNYSWFRRIGSVFTDGSSNIRAFARLNDYFFFGSIILDIDDTSVSDATTETGTLSVPPDQIAIVEFRVNASLASRVEANILNKQGGDRQVHMVTQASGNNDSKRIDITGQAWVDENSQVDYFGGVAGGGSESLDRIRIRTYGWIDDRGRNA